MKTKLMACALALTLSGSAFAASRSTVPGAAPPPADKPPVVAATPECAAGFTKSNAQGTAATDHSWICTSAVVACPAPAAGMTGGLIGPQAKASGTGAQFSYGCAYRKPPK